MRKTLYLCLLSLSLVSFANTINLPLEKWKTDRSESKTPVYEQPIRPPIHSSACILPETITRPGKIVFKAKVKQFLRGGPNGSNRHFGIRLFQEKNSYVQFYSRGQGISSIIMKNGIRTYLSDPRRGQGFQFPTEENAQWADIEIVLGTNLTEVLVNSSSQCLISRGSLPIQKIEMYSYFVNYEMTEPQFIPDQEEKKVEFRKDPVFYLSFENTPNAVSSAGNATLPLKQQDIQFADGISGKALKISSRKADGKSILRPKLIYDVKNVFGNEGSLSFWYSSDWDGFESNLKNIPTYMLIGGSDGKNEEKLRIFMWNWLRFDMGRIGKIPAVSIRRNVRSGWFHGDFHHLVLVWKNDGWNKAYIDGIPFEQPWFPAGQMFTKLDLKSIESLSIAAGQNWRLGEGIYDELKIYNRQLSPEEINEEYRKIVPVDLMIFKNHIQSDEKDFLTLFVSPGGSTVTPKSSSYPATNADITLNANLVNLKNGMVIPLGKRKENVTKEIRLDFPVTSVPDGFWRLEVEMASKSGKIRRSFSVTAAKETKASADGEIRKGKLLFEKKFTPETMKDFLKAGPIRFVKTSSGSYVESGNEKGDRFSFIIPFSKEVLNKKPCLLEIEWPDDKERSMGLYMYAENKAQQHRDRLGGGILAGDEFPNSRKMQTVSYLFYPGKENYLFEARTMASGMPAAISSVRVYELQEEKLPSLALNLPKNQPARSFGFFDEDQSFNQTLNYDNDREISSPARYKYILDRLAEYLDYVGKDSFTNPFFRYMGRQYPSLSALTSADMNYTYMTEFLGRRGKKVYATLDIKSIPHLLMFPEEREKIDHSGKVMLKTSGIPCQLFIRPRPNHVHPEIHAALIEEVRRVAELYGRIPGFSGICLWGDSSLFGGLDTGYEDVTIAKFTKDTGITVPLQSMVKRKEFLTAPERLEAWLKWRSAQSTELFRKMTETLRKINPNLSLIVMFDEFSFLNNSSASEFRNQLPSSLSERIAAEKGGKFSALCYQENGLDFPALKKIPGLETRPIRIYNTARHTLHWGKNRPPADEIFYSSDLNRQMITSGGGVCSYPSYFETFTNSLQNNRFNSYFQNADLKPHGRYFLKELVYPVYVADARNIMFGAQPFASWGHESETREFARAFRSLPSLDFKTAEGQRDPVVVRYLNTPQGTWFYAVSMLNGNAEVKLQLSGNRKYTDLSDGRQLSGDRLELKAYQLRSFFSADPLLKIKGVRVIPSSETTAFYTEQIKQIRAIASQLRQEKMLSEEQSSAVEQMNKHFTSGEYAALDVILFSVPVRDIRKNRNNLSFIQEQAKMAQRGHYAVNCGSTEYLRIKNGTLFAPDHRWNGKYGYFGNYDCVTREIRDVKDQNPELYRNEAYHVDGYRFAVPNGQYKVRLYMKVGFKRNIKPRYYMFDILANGKTLAKDFDVYAECGFDFDRTTIPEYGPLSVSNGILELTFLNHQKQPWARLINALEIIPIKK